MTEAQLTSFLFQNLQDGGVKKLVNTNAFKQVRMDREVGNSAYIADICIAANSHSGKCEFNSQKVRIIAIEVKISDWENGLYQAWRYNNFAEKSFLAIYKPYAHKVKIEEFEDNNVGLIVFDETTVSIVRQPKINRFRNNTYEMEVREKIWDNLSNTQSILPAF